MRTAPLNYLLALALIGILWVASALFLGNWLAENALLQLLAPSDFARLFTLMLSIGAVLGFGLTAAWLNYGSKPDAGARLAQSKKTWDTLFTSSIVVGALLSIVTIVMLRNEDLTFGQLALIVLGLSLVSWGGYWLATVLWSPNGVKNVPRPLR